MKVVFTQQQIRERVQILAQEISAHFDSLTVLVCLKGAMFFAADLLRYMSVKGLIVDTVQLGSYGPRGDRQGQIRLVSNYTTELTDRDVLIVEDIIDTGHTAQFLDRLILLNSSPKSISVCSLLSKPSLRQANIKIDYLGFEADDKWLVGYGLDYKEQYRNLPDIREYNE